MTAYVESREGECVGWRIAASHCRRSSKHGNLGALLSKLYGSFPTAATGRYLWRNHPLPGT